MPLDVVYDAPEDRLTKPAKPPPMASALLEVIGFARSAARPEWLSARQSPSEVWRTGEVSTLASHSITPVEHNDNSEHRPGINDLRCVIQNNSNAFSVGVPKFFMTVARQYRHQA